SGSAQLAQLLQPSHVDYRQPLSRRGAPDSHTDGEGARRRQAGLTPREPHERRIGPGGCRRGDSELVAPPVFDPDRSFIEGGSEEADRSCIPGKPVDLSEDPPPLPALRL